MKHFIFKVVKYEPIFIEGHIHIEAKSKHKAHKKLCKWGEYNIEEVKRVN